MGARRGRLADAALDLPTAPIPAAWTGRGVVYPLPLDMSKVFDHVSRDFLTHIMRQKAVSASIVG